VKQEHRFSKRYASTRVGGAICLLGWRVAGNAKMARPAGACREREHRDTAFVPPTRSLLRSGLTDLRAAGVGSGVVVGHAAANSETTPESERLKPPHGASLAGASPQLQSHHPSGFAKQFGLEYSKVP